MQFIISGAWQNDILYGYYFRALHKERKKERKRDGESKRDGEREKERNNSD